MKLSKSSVNSFLKCRREFKYQFLDGIREEPNEYMQIGLDVHAIAERFIQNFDIEGDFYEQLQDIATSYGSEYVLDTHLFNLSKFFDEVFHDDDVNYKVFSAEEYIYDEKHDFSGLADLILEDEDGDLIIVDYKTGKTKPIKKYLLELTYYKMLVESKYPDKHVASAGIYFTKDGGMRFTNFVEEQRKGSFVTQEDYDTAIELLDFIRNEVDENNIYPEPQFLCKYCTYYDRCQNDGGF